MTPQMVPDVPAVAQPRPDSPVPFGVEAATGHVRPPYHAPDPDDVELDSTRVQERGKPSKRLAVVPTVDARNLKQAGWGVVFASDADPAVIAALDPLLKLRQAQVGDDDLFKIFKGDDGVHADQSAVTWLSSKGSGVGLAVVDPSNGVPYHLLLVGSPEQIPFEFQYTLDLQWSVGRLDFDTPEEYAAYAKNVVDYETASDVTQSKTAAMWMPANGDLATNLLCNDVGLPFFQKPLGLKQGFSLSTFLAAQATKAKLSEILGANPPAVLFTGSHGLEVAADNPADQRERQGALITQEWKPSTAVDAGACFSGADLPAGAKLHGMIHVMFACFGGGCPTQDNYPEPGVTPKPLAPKPIVSRLPQRMLANGALAVIGHIDRAWNFSFQTGSGMPQNQVLRSIIEALMLGLPAGLAMDFTNLQWGTLAAKLGMDLGPTSVNAPVPAVLANLVIARDDARNFALFGDPAVRLRVDKMK